MTYPVLWTLRLASFESVTAIGYFFKNIKNPLLFVLFSVN